MKPFGPIPVSQLKARATSMFDALEQGRPVLISRRGRIEAVIEPPTADLSGALSLYAIGGGPELPEITSSTFNNGATKSLLDDLALQQHPVLVTRDRRVYGTMRPATPVEIQDRGDVSDAELGEALNAELVDFRRRRPDATALEVAQHMDRFRSSVEAVDAETIHADVESTVDDLVGKLQELATSGISTTDTLTQLGLIDAAIDGLIESKAARTGLRGPSDGLAAS